jgi:hypothetical protein
MHRLTDDTPAGRAPTEGCEDRGAILILALVLSVLLGVVATALASYVAVGLKTSGVTDRRLEQLTATDGGLRAGTELLKQNPANCTTGLAPITLTIDGATVSVWCEQSGAATSRWTPYRIHSTMTLNGATRTGVADVQGRTSSYGPCIDGQRCIVTINSWAVDG